MGYSPGSQELVTTEQLTLLLSPHEGPIWTLPRAKGSTEGDGQLS